MAMKRGGLLNSDLLRIIARAGHGDRIVVTDRGFPLSSGPWTEAIDLSVTPGLPRLMDVLAPLVAELAIEGFVLADETEVHNPGVATAIRALLESRLETRIPHTDFKAQVLGGGIAGQGASVPTGSASGPNGRIIAQVRTGEWTPYANVMLVCGVSF
jgi:D-ribose pyranase